jgi:hypothetical protein
MADAANRVVVYYQTQYDHNETLTTQWGHYVSPLPLIQVISHLILAAFHLNLGKPVKLALNDNAPDTAYYTQMWKDIARLKENNVKILGMLGGAAQGSYECLTPEHWKTYYPILRNMIREYQLDGIDLDVEEAYSLKDVVRLIKQLKADFGPDFIVTLAPVASALEDHDGGLSGFDYIQLEKEAGHLINWYNAQFYSGFGTFTPDDQYIDMVEKMNISPNRLVAIVLTSPDNGEGYDSTKTVVAGVKALVKKYGNEFGGIAGWEYFNSLPDPTKPWQWATLMRDTIREARRTLTGGSGSKTGTGKGKGKGTEYPYPIPPRVGGTRPAATDLPTQQQQGAHQGKHPHQRVSPSGKVPTTAEPSLSPSSRPTHTHTSKRAHTYTHTPLPTVNGHPFVTGPIKATRTATATATATADPASPTMSASSQAVREERASVGAKHAKGTPAPRSTGEDVDEGEESQSKAQAPSPGFAKSTDPQTPPGVQTLGPARPAHAVDTSSEDSSSSDTPSSDSSASDTPPPLSKVPIKPYHPKPDYKPHLQYPPAQEAPPPSPPSPPAPSSPASAPSPASSKSSSASSKSTSKSTSKQSTSKTTQPQPQQPTPIRPPASPRESAFLSRVVSERLVPVSIAPGETTYVVQEEVEDFPEQSLAHPEQPAQAEKEREREKELQGSNGCELGGRCVL